MATTKFTTNPLVLLDEIGALTWEDRAIGLTMEKVKKKKCYNTGKRIKNAPTRNRTGG